MPRYGLGDHVLLISGMGDEDTGGGVWAYDGGEPAEVDRLATMGLAFHDDRVARLLQSADDIESPGELMVYDATGVLSYARIDGLCDVHDVLWDGAHYGIVSSLTNAIVRVTPAGEVVERWEPPTGTGDAWHLNSLVLHERRLVCCAFGRFSEHRAWTKYLEEGPGMVFDVESDRDLVTGLSAPHHPRPWDGGWAVCDSGRHRLAYYDAAGTELRDIALGGFTRGLARTDSHVFVGVSVARDEGGVRSEDRLNRTAHFAIVDRATDEVVETVPIEAREIYDIVVVPAELAAGMRNGFRTNPLRVRESDQRALFEQAGVQPRKLWALSDPLLAEDCRVAIDADVPPEAPPGALLTGTVHVRNVGRAILVSAPPYPVNLAYRWFDEAGGLLSEGSRTPLTPSLPPGEGHDYPLQVEIPRTPGRYTLEVTLVQEHVRWFPEADPANGSRHRVIVDA